MSRLDGKFTPDDATPVDAADILAALERNLAARGGDRREAIARYLSAGEGWKEALQKLGGTFAGPDKDDGLTPPKGE